MNGEHKLGDGVSPTQAAQGERLVRFPEYCSITGETRSIAYEKIAVGIAPKPIKDGRASLWVLSEVHAYVARKIATSPRKA